MKKGLFITFEGLDKVGKSTQVENLVKHLKSKDLKVTLVREPGSTEISEKIRNSLLDRENAGKISDRFYDSTTAYQGYGRGLDIKLIHSVNMEATGNLVPDLTILMSVGPLAETIDNHKRFQSSSSDDRLERESLEFRERVRMGFLEIARREPDRFLVVDAEDTIENVAAKIVERVDRLLQSK
jgi:dTMP kinase